MKLEQSFEVAAPLERVWQTLVDVEHVAPCLPGAAVTGRNEDGSYNGTFTVKIGPTTASYTGRLEMESIDEASHTATMQAQGTDKRGQGGAKATIFSRLAPVDGAGTRVEVVTDYHITGRLARFGRGGMIEDISERLLREFAKRLQSSLAAQPDTVVSQSPAASETPAAPPTVVSERRAAPSEPPTVVSQSPAAPETPAAPPTVESERLAVPSEVPAAPSEPARDETIFAPAPTGSAPPEERVWTRGNIPPAPAEEPASVGEGPPPPPEAPASLPGAVTPPGGEVPPPGGEVPPAGEVPPPAGEVTPRGGDVMPPPPPPPPAEPSPLTPGPATVGAGPAGPAADEPAPPPPPSPGPPPVATPPPAASTPPSSAATRPPLEHPPQPSEPMQGLSLVGGALWTRVKRNPAPATAAAGVAVVLLMARRRRRRSAW